MEEKYCLLNFLFLREGLKLSLIKVVFFLYLGGGGQSCQTQTLYRISLHTYCGHDISMSDPPIPRPPAADSLGDFPQTRGVYLYKI